MIENVHKFPQYEIIHVSGHESFDVARRNTILHDLERELPDYDIQEYFGTQPTIFEDYDHLVLGRCPESGRTIGLFGARWLHAPRFRFLYLWTAVVGHRFRKTLLFQRMTEVMIGEVSRQNRGEFPALVVTKTYNPKVYSLIRDKFGRAGSAEFYPQVGQEQDPVMTRIAVDIAATLGKNLDFIPSTGAFLGGQSAVSPNFFPKMEMDRDPAVNEHFQSNLTRDDQILCILAQRKTGSVMSLQEEVPPAFRTKRRSSYA